MSQLFASEVTLSMKFKLSLVAMLCSSALLAQQHAHQHGIATATLVIDQQQIEWQMDIPADQVVGFEHAPNTPQEQAQQAAQLQKLQPHSWLVWPSAANCQLKNASFAPEPGDSAHVDYVSSASWQCADVSQIKQLQLDLFTLTTGLEQVQLQYVTPQGQGAATLTMDQNQLSFADN